MTSILTNTAAMTALQSLTATQKSLAKVQKQIATGLAVNDATDNASVWAIASNMRADVSSLGAVSTAITVGNNIVGTAVPAMTAVLNTLQALKSTFSRVVTTAGQPISAGATDSISAIESAIAAQQQSVIAIMGSSSSNGINLLDGSAGTVNVVDSYSRNANGNDYGSLAIASAPLALGGTATSAPTQTSGGGGLLGGSLSASSTRATTGGYTGSSTAGGTTTYYGTYASDSVLGFQITSSTTTADFLKISQGLDAAINSVINASAQLGTYSTVLSTQGTAISTLTDSTNAGIGALVDADMNVASTRLQALQVQQQLGIQALSIANENSQSILKLFGG